MGIQIAPKKEKLVDPIIERIDIFVNGDPTIFDRDAYIGDLSKNEEYHVLAKNASRYLSVRGMYEKKNGFEYTVYDKNLNPDANTWKRYDTQLEINSAGLE